MELSPSHKEVIKSQRLKIRKPRVMVFDDEDLILINLKKWLSRKDYEVLTFNNPTACPMYEKGTTHCMNENPCADIIITDFNMPEMNGIDLLKYQSQRGCKIDKKNKALISANITENINESGYSFFEKPLDLSFMSDWLNECERRIDLSLPIGSVYESSKFNS